MPKTSQSSSIRLRVAARDLVGIQIFLVELLAACLLRGGDVPAFPLHPAGKPGIERAKHLSEVKVPMPFLQGTRDELATLAWLRQVVVELGARATLKLLLDADHSFQVPARCGRIDADVRNEALACLTEWAGRISPPS